MSCVTITCRCLRKLPSDLLNALDLTEAIAQKEAAVVHTPPASELQLLQQELREVIGECNLDKHNRLIARELVKHVLSSACNKVGLNGSFFLSNSAQGCRASASPEGKHELGGVSERLLKSDTDRSTSFVNYRDEKRDSMVSFMSVESEGSRGESFMSQYSSVDRMAPHTGHDSGIDMPVSRYSRETTAFGSQQASTAESDNGIIQQVAKKLVKKALHLACKRCEAMFRRSSIDYLVASTKRMRITDSPSPPPPTLFEEDCLDTTQARDSGSDCTEVHVEDKREDSPTPNWRNRGTKRARSESHDVFMMKELQRFRETQLVEHDHTEEDTDSTTRRTLAVPRGRTSRRFLQPHSPGGMHSLVSGMSRISIAEGNSESDNDNCASDPDEEYTILNAVTKRVPTPVSPSSGDFGKSDNNSTIDDIKGGTDGSSLKFGEELSGTTISSESATQGPMKPELAVNGTMIQDQERYTPEVLLKTEQRPGLPSSSTPIEIHMRPEEAQASPDSSLHFISNVDFFIVVHSHPVPGVCQKFLCNNTNEVNLMYHCWLFPEIPFDPTITVSEQLSLGIFVPEGVQPVHLDLDDAGSAFYFLDQR